MALRVTGMGLVVVLSAMLWAKAMAQSGCTTVLIGMAPCLNYITGSSSSPSSSCCSQLASVVQSQPRCLCVALNGGGAALGITINQTLALALPGACNVQTPPVSQCDADGPATPPLLASPMGSPEGTPDFPTSSSVSGSGSKTVPSNGADSSDGSIIMKMRPQLIAILLFMASYASVSSNL
ncbi:non-specific lipid-transfer protein-like protein At2g13820 isoform X2 [Vitis riparia]|uniref:non-specific lipid-transfer protein-like protein At2g13820 isoform X2 n=1 Tax=Vitis riparia TaxID=96939 RepID=UPI00155A65D2|nr:non-specific lipid-transfer protein-like protein At2g13820 isoform X2 [Vitis riparia]